MPKPSPDLTPLLDTVFKPTTPYLDALTEWANRLEKIDEQEEGNAKNRSILEVHKRGRDGLL